MHKNMDKVTGYESPQTAAHSSYTGESVSLAHETHSPQNILKPQLVKKDEEIRSLRTKLNEAYGELSRVHTNTKLQDELSKKDQEIVSLKRELKDAIGRIKKLEEENVVLNKCETKALELAKEVRFLKGMNEDLLKEISDMKKELELKMDELAFLRNQSSLYESHLAALKLDLQASTFISEKQVSENKTKLEENYKLTIRDLQNRNALLENKLTFLQSKPQSTEKVTLDEKYQCRIQELEDHVKSLTRQLEKWLFFKRADQTISTDTLKVT